MSGVFGVIDPVWEVDVDELTEKMAKAMSHRAWFRVEKHTDRDRNLAVGQIGIGIFNQTPQPFWNASCSVALFMAGEFYEVDAPEAVEKYQPDEKVALFLYEKYGEKFVHMVKGSFIIAIWDANRNRFLLLNDRFGLYPLYYALEAGRLIFAPEVKGILCDPQFSRKLDLVALAQYMRFQHLLGERTFFKGIRLLPDASILSYDLTTASLEIQRYWDFKDIPYQPRMGFREAVEESGRLFRQAVQRLSGDRRLAEGQLLRPGVFLSGGLDSRFILGLVKHRPVVSLTFGAKNCRDVYYAEKIARTAGSKHYWFDLPDGNWVKEYADFHLDLTEGFHSWIHAHGISMLPEARRLVDVNLTGWDGGTVFADDYGADPLLVSAVDNQALTTYLFYLFNQKFTWPSITEAEERYLYCEPLGRKLHGLAFDSFREEFSPYLEHRQDARWKYFYIRNSCGRLTKNMVTFTRSHIEVRFPFFDYDLFDFIFSLPGQMRADKEYLLYRSVIERETPRMARIPYDYNEMLPTPNSGLRAPHAWIVKAKRRINRHIGPIFPSRPTLYADYENYLRGGLREWAQGILYDRRLGERDIFDPAFVRTLMNRHLSGIEEWTIGKIAPIITYEMMLRRLYD